MKTILATILFTSLSLSLVIVSQSTAGSAACVKATLETKLVGDACKAGGQAAAKDAMKNWVKATKAKRAGLECSSCHGKMAPSYELKADGLKLFRELGGE
jgi:hypothetical protein